MYHTLRSPAGLAILVSLFATAILFYLTHDDETLNILQGVDTSTADWEMQEAEYARLQMATNPMAYARNMNEYLAKVVQDLDEQEQEQNGQNEEDHDQDQDTAARHRWYHDILNTRRHKNDIVQRMSLEKDEAGNPLINWSNYTYMTYATDPDYLCNALMLFDQLRNAHLTKATLSLLYPREWGMPTNDFERLAKEADNQNKKGAEKDHTMALLRTARDKYDINLIPVKPLAITKKNMNRKELEKERRKRPDTWKKSFTKMLAFDQTAFERIIMIDADAYLMDSIDYLFFEEDESVFGNEAAANRASKFWTKPEHHTVPAVQAPPAYWLVPDTPGELAAAAVSTGYGTPHFSTMLEVVTPSKENFRRIRDRFRVLEQFQLKKQARSPHKFYDMELVNDVFANVSIFADHELFADPEMRAEMGDEAWGLGSDEVSSKYARPPNSYGILDHRGLILLTGELAQRDHTKYLKDYVALQKDAAERGSDNNEVDPHHGPASRWDPLYAVSTSAYIHFSDWPFPKPWVQATAAQVLASQPPCVVTGRQRAWFRKKEVMDCEAQKLWHMFFHDFAKRRYDVCNFYLEQF